MNTITKIIKKDKLAWNLFNLSCFLYILTEFLLGIQSSFLLSLLENKNHSLLQLGILFSLFLMIFPTFVSLVSQLLKINFVKKKMILIRNFIFNNIQKLNYSKFKNKSRDYYISLLTNDIFLFSNQYFSVLEKINSAPFLIIIGFFILLFLDNKLFILMFVIISGFFILSILTKNIKEKLNIKLSNLNLKYLSVSTNIFDGIDIIKENEISEYFINEFRKISKKRSRFKFKFSIINNFQEIISSKIGMIILVFSIVYFTEKISNSQIIFSQAIFSIIIINLIIQNVIDLSNQYGFYEASLNLIDTKIEDNNEDSLVLNNDTQMKFNKSISFNNFSFSYNDKHIFENVTLQLEKGKKYLLQGSSGTGKTTFLNVLSKSDKNFSGEILIDQKKISEISDEAYFENIEYINNDVFLFNDTIYNNITLYKHYSNVDVLNVIKSVNLNFLINQNKEGLDYKIINNGENISAGEKQKIAVARAILKKKEIILADEITANLSFQDATEIEEILFKLSNTLIFSTHRSYLPTFLKYDKLLKVKNRHIFLSDIQELQNEKK